MPAARHTAIAKATPNVLWEKLADLESWPRWVGVPWAAESVQLEATEKEEMLGAVVVFKGRLPYRLFATITDWRPPRRLAFKIYRSEYPSDRLTFRWAEISIELAEVDDRRTQVICKHVLLGKGPAGALYAATIMRLFLKSNVQRMLDGLAAAVVR